MAQDRLVPPTISVLGFAVLIIGSMGYMGAIKMHEVICYVMMVAGIIGIIGAMAFMMYQNSVSLKNPEEE